MFLKVKLFDSFLLSWWKSLPSVCLICLQRQFQLRAWVLSVGCESLPCRADPGEEGAVQPLAGPAAPSLSPTQ